MKKIYLMLIIFAFFIVINNVNAAEFCSGVNVCPSPTTDPDKYNYFVDCNGVSDGFCPENYSKNIWVDNVICPTVNVGKCYPCDPDCGTCPGVELIVTPAAERCTPINIQVKVDTDNGNIHVECDDPFCAHGFDEVQCKKAENHINNDLNEPCVAYYQDVYNPDKAKGNKGLCSPGFSYCYSARMQSGDLQGQYAMMCGYVKPRVTLTLTPDLAPTYVYDQQTYSQIIVSATGESSAGIRDLKIEVSKWSSKEGSVGFYPINMRAGEDYCSFRCLNNICPPLDTITFSPKVTPATLSNANFQISNCGNGNYRIQAEADDDQSIGNATRDITITNSNECTDECPIFTSKTLNTVVAKVKTWINPS